MRLLKIAGRDPAGNAKPFSVTDNGEVLVKESPELSQQIEDIKNKDFATQTTLAAILAKLSADPATQTTLNALKTLFDNGSAKVQLSGSNLALRQTIVTGAKTVTSTAAEIFAGASRLNNRHIMVVTNTGADIVYIGASGVTTSNGFPLFSQDTLRIEFDPTSSVGVFACTSGPNVQVRVVEMV